MNNIDELHSLWRKRWDKKLAKFLDNQVIQKQKEILEVLKEIIHSEKENGKIISDSARAYFRIKRIDNKDCNPLYELYDIANINLTESLLNVLGYDKMIPEIVDQQKIIEIFFKFGDQTNYKYCSDPRYGLAAACAGWEPSIVESFLKYCLEINDAPLKYVAENSLKRKYVRLRAIN